MPATRSRSDDVARTAAAAGLFSSWVRPADSEPSASSRSRWPTLRLRALVAEEQALEQVHRHREPLAHQLRRSRRRRARRTATAVSARIDCVVGLRHPVAEVGLPRAGVDAALVGAADLDVVAADPARQRDRALEQHVEAASPGSPSRKTTPGLVQLDAAALAQPAAAARRSASRTGTACAARRRRSGSRVRVMAHSPSR